MKTFRDLKIDDQVYCITPEGRVITGYVTEICKELVRAEYDGVGSRVSTTLRDEYLRHGGTVSVRMGNGSSSYNDWYSTVDYKKAMKIGIERTREVLDKTLERLKILTDNYGK